MKRLQFILGTLADTIVGLTTKLNNSKLGAATKPMTWAKRIAKETARTHSRRYEHWMHAKYCQGEYDHLRSPKVAAYRKARCAKICGLCRYINSVAVWPVPNHRRPPVYFLKALEQEQYCLTYRTERPYKMIPLV